MQYRRPDLFCYRVAQTAAWALSSFVFRRKMLRNEIRRVKGPYVVIANHQCALDFVNLIGATRRPMHFVISNSFYSTLPVKKITKRQRLSSKLAVMQPIQATLPSSAVSLSATISHALTDL